MYDTMYTEVYYLLLFKENATLQLTVIQYGRNNMSRVVVSITPMEI